jgi:hypothetical protein
LESPGIDALHPQVRADIERFNREISDAVGRWRLPTSAWKVIAPR